MEELNFIEDNYIHSFVKSILNIKCTKEEEKTIQISLNEAIEEFKEPFRFLNKKNGYYSKVFIIGNGASSSMASHYATDLTKNCKIPAESLNDGTMLTCFGNDYCFEEIYMRMLRVKATKEDILIAISSSGRSENIINAVDEARQIGMKIITFSGFSENNLLRSLGDLNFYVNHVSYGIVESAHNFIIHYLLDELKSKLEEKAWMITG